MFKWMIVFNQKTEWLNVRKNRSNNMLPVRDILCLNDSYIEKVKIKGMEKDISRK